MITYRKPLCVLIVLLTPVFIVGLSGPRSDVTELGERFRAHVEYLASDDLAGRGVGTTEIELAAKYIAMQFNGTGVAPLGDGGTWFQSFPIALHRRLTDAARLEFTGDSLQRKLRDDFIPLSFSSSEAFTGGVVFCGYGIDAEEKKRNDFAGVELKGRVTLILLGEPPLFVDADGRASPFSWVRNKVYNAKDRGAVAVLLVNPRPAPGDEDALTHFDDHGADAFGVPAFHVRRAFADAMLKAGGLGSLDELQPKLDDGAVAAATLGHVSVSGTAALEQQMAEARNVVGVVRGEGPLADECVVVGAHYDHLGIQKPMARKFRDGKLVTEDVRPQIHNGADDNASGVAGLIEIARSLSAGPKLKRSIVFVAFSAEESGLHGSKFYVEHPAYPLEKTIAMLNMDMIGRMPSGANRVQVFGGKSGTGMEELLQAKASEASLAVSPTNDTGGRSDHAPFARKNIPVMHFFTGHHEDYHQPTDDTAKINASDGARVTQLVYSVARELAEREARPTFQVVKLDAMPAGDTGGAAPTYRVVMGIAPGYGDDGKPGMAVESVTAQGPADLAGMKAGDRIVRIGEKKVANIYDYMASTRGNKPGDTVEVCVSRDGKELVLKVKLASAR